MILVEDLIADGVSGYVAAREGERLSVRFEALGGFDGIVWLERDERVRGQWQYLDRLESDRPVSEPAVPVTTLFRVRVREMTAGTARVTLEVLPKILAEYRNRNGLRVFKITEGGIELGDSTGGASIASDGTLTLQGSATTWDDLRFPSQGINPPGAASDPSTETATGLKLFRSGQTNILAGVAQMPHEWVEGSVVIPHVHWQKTVAGAGNVLWRFEYDNVVNPGEVSLLTYANVLNTSTPVGGTPDDNTANRNLISSFGNLDMTDKRISSCILWKLSRIGGDVTDDYGSNARLVEFDIHYEIDGFGSNFEFVK